MAWDDVLRTGGQGVDEKGWKMCTPGVRTMMLHWTRGTCGDGLPVTDDAEVK